MRLWKEIEEAQKRLRHVILRTPMIYSDTFSKRTGKEIFLKLENLQKTGSFKVRGAYNKLSRLSPSLKKGEFCEPRVTRYRSRCTAMRLDVTMNEESVFTNPSIRCRIVLKMGPGKHC